MSLALPDAPSLRPGTRLDRYELLCPIAHGGMASVWIARATGKHGFEKLFAIKTILPQYASDVRFQQMFLDEARIASYIEHPNVAHIVDLGEENETLFLVMEWIDGDSLSKLNRTCQKKKKRLPLGLVLRVLADVSGGLHAAHELRARDGTNLGVVHRDVSPQNILLTKTGTAKLIDFGVAKARDRVAGDTSAGQLKGKIHYMAPEQALGRSVDRRADVWSVGAVAYHLLAGVPPFDGANELATLHLVTSGKAPLPLPDYVPIAVVDAVFRALVDSPAERIGSALELQRAFEQAMVDAGVQTSTADVADFIAIHLGDRAEARRKALEHALVAASERGRTSSLPPLQADSGSLDHAVSRVNAVPAMGGQDPGELGSNAGRQSAPGAVSWPSRSEAGSRPSRVGHAAVSRGSGRPEFAADFDAPGSVASNATLGSAASEIQWPPPARPRAGWHRWAAWGTAIGMFVGATALGSAWVLRPRPDALSTSTAPPTAVPSATEPTPELPAPEAQQPQPEPSTATTATTVPPVHASASATGTVPHPPHAVTGGTGTKPVVHRPPSSSSTLPASPSPSKSKDYGF